MPPDDPSRPPTITSTTLLHGLKDPGNRTLWNQYVERYRPMIVPYGTRLGLTPEDAEDVAQNSLLEFSRSYQAGHHDRRKGRLRSWLFGIVRLQVQNFRRRRSDREVQVGDSTYARVAEQPESDGDLERLWEEEWRNALLRQCLTHVRNEVRPVTFQAFELFALQGVPAEEVGQRLGLTPNAVFGAKRRVMARIQELVVLLEETW